MEIDPSSITELAQSISEIGLLQPILLRVDGERFEVVAGHRRYLAHKQLELATIKAVVRVLTDSETAIIRATENLARVDLTPVEEALIFRDLVDNHSMRVDQIGLKVGKSPGLVKRRMDLLKMAPQLQKALHEKRISISVAEELWPISDLATLDYYLSFALDGGCTRDVARSWCKDWKDSIRRQSSAGEAGGEILSPQEPRPVFLPCDLCNKPVQLGQDWVIRICPVCGDIIKKML
jgi:ParB/RepB/Spo0J family partition protein